MPLVPSLGPGTAPCALTARRPARILERLMEGGSLVPRVVLWPMALWYGAAVMAFELAGARLLMPVFGMGIGAPGTTR
jgi:hypothetical protein